MLGKDLLFKDVLLALQQRGRHEEAVRCEEMVFSHFVKNVSRQQIYNLTIDEVSFLIDIDNLLKGSKVQREGALKIMDDLACKSLTGLVDEFKQKAPETFKEYVLGLEREGFFVAVNEKYRHLLSSST